MKRDRITKALTELVEELQESLYNLERIAETSEVDQSKRYTKGRFATAKTALGKTICAIEDGLEAYKKGESE